MPENNRELIDLATLYEITRALASSDDLRKCLEESLTVLAARTSLGNGAVTIANPLTGQIETEVAPGMTAEARKRGIYKFGEGITGRVVASGAPIVVPQISQEPLFLNKTRARAEKNQESLSFLCVPIKHGANTIGALSVDRSYKEGLDFEKDLQFLTVLSGLIAQTVVRIQAVNQERERLEQENTQLRRELTEKYRVASIVSNSNRMQEVFEMIHRVADSNATILLRGESGTGKTMVAKAIHHNSKRAKAPFVAVNCSALPETLLESELFGHEKGAFTGAQTAKKGRFELAEGGTLFLDEIGELSQAVQIKLLNVVQDREFQRLGGIAPLKCNVRLITATNKDLEKAVEEGSFREDLYYRLNVFPIYLPPLRERRTDIMLLADFFLQKYNEENGKQIRRISTPAIDLLVQYHWPGNVRELQNCIERAVLICDEDSIKSYHLPPSLQTSDSVNERSNPLSFAAAVDNFERELIIDSLKKCQGNQTRAAQLLDTSLRIINYKIAKLDIHPRQFKIAKP
ncbi:MAG: sigma-54-dependent Fis family transcriptional regulator [Deltaproteobacteria bacterium RIFOXYD12_FULL_56_24]|nr:MAG: sigma-54-dependent Fis family transcriptional regulator [Deltaproteobacteria bacterium RIFOXYD12_FULL_56_24]